VGLLCFSDWLASLAMVALKKAGFAIPEEVAVMGLGDEELVCSVTRPQLTSVDLNQINVGQEAAALLESLMAGGTVPSEPLRIAPIGVIVRSSTQMLACEDQDVSAAVDFIESQMQAGHCPRVREVCQKVLVPRRTLDSKFVRHLGHTTADVITRAQVQVALRMLERLDTKLQDVANRAGLGSSAHLARFVRRHTGKTPGEYRRWAQARAAAT
jgi:LacI family transcriptional regulator